MVRIIQRNCDHEAEFSISFIFLSKPLNLKQFSVIVVSGDSEERMKNTNDVDYKAGRIATPARVAFTYIHTV
jgi:hypothetical protein